MLKNFLSKKKYVEKFKRHANKPLFLIMMTKNKILKFIKDKKFI